MDESKDNGESGCFLDLVCAVGCHEHLKGSLDEHLLVFLVEECADWRESETTWIKLGDDHGVGMKE